MSPSNVINMANSIKDHWPLNPKCTPGMTFMAHQKLQADHQLIRNCPWIPITHDPTCAVYCGEAITSWIYSVLPSKANKSPELTTAAEGRLDTQPIKSTWWAAINWERTWPGWERTGLDKWLLLVWLPNYGARIQPGDTDPKSREWVVVDPFR